MNKDIRLAVSFKGHRKRKRLRRILGDRSDSYLIDLWLTVATDCPEGILTGWDEIDVADACNWSGDPGQIVQALIESRWLEEIDGVFVIHDWCEHQGWACNANARSEASSRSVLLRWTIKQIKKKNIPKFKDWFASEYAYQKGHNTEDVLRYYEAYTNRINPNSAGNTPSPLPSPLPSPIKETPDHPPKKSSQKKSDTTPSGSFFKPVFDKNKINGHEDYFHAINKACDRILTLPAKSKKFSPQKWAQICINKKKHPGAVAETLDGLVLIWDDADDPWGMCNSILRTKNGNWNEKEAVAIHNELKNMKPGRLEFFTQGLLQEMS